MEIGEAKPTRTMGPTTSTECMPQSVPSSERLSSHNSLFLLPTEKMHRTHDALTVQYEREQTSSAKKQWKSKAMKSLKKASRIAHLSKSTSDCSIDTASTSSSSNKSETETYFYPDNAAIEYAFLERYELGPRLGHGSSADVYRATRKSTSEQFAVKVVRRNTSINDSASLLQEALALLTLPRHTHILPLVELFESRATLLLVLPLVEGGSLLEALVRDLDTNCSSSYSEARVRTLFLQLVQAVLWAHEHGLVHRDLKPDNLLLITRTESAQPLSRTDNTVSGDHLLVIDWGLSASRPGLSGSGPLSRLRRLVYRGLRGRWGTPGYMAPEVLHWVQGVWGGYGPQAEAWTLGALLLELLTGDAPAPGGSSPGPAPALGELSPEVWTLITGLLQPHPWTRLSLHTALAQAAWFSPAFRPPERELTRARGRLTTRVHGRWEREWKGERQSTAVAQ